MHLGTVITFIAICFQPGYGKSLGAWNSVLSQDDYPIQFDWDTQNVGENSLATDDQTDDQSDDQNDDQSDDRFQNQKSIDYSDSIKMAASQLAGNGNSKVVDDEKSETDTDDSSVKDKWKKLAAIVLPNIATYLTKIFRNSFSDNKKLTSKLLNQIYESLPKSNPEPEPKPKPVNKSAKYIKQFQLGQPTSQDVVNPDDVMFETNPDGSYYLKRLTNTKRYLNSNDDVSIGEKVTYAVNKAIAEKVDDALAQQAKAQAQAGKSKNAKTKTAKKIKT